MLWLLWEDGRGGIWGVGGGMLARSSGGAICVHICDPGSSESRWRFCCIRYHHTDSTRGGYLFLYSITNCRSQLDFRDVSFLRPSSVTRLSFWVVSGGFRVFSSVFSNLLMPLRLRSLCSGAGPCSHVWFTRAVKLLDGGGECVSSFVGTAPWSLRTPRDNAFPMRTHRKSNSR